MEKELIDLAREIYNGMKVENKCFIIPGVYYFSRLGWIAHDESPESEKIAQRVCQFKKMTHESYNLNLCGEPLPETEIPDFLVLVNSSYNLRGQGMFVASLPVYEQLMQNPYNKCSKMGCLLPGFADDVLQHVFTHDNDSFYLKGGKENVFARCRMPEAEGIMLYGNDVLSVVYAAYAYGMHYIDYGHYPKLTLIIPNREISREVAAFLRNLNIDYQIYDEQMRQSILCEIITKKQLLILPPERIVSAWKFSYKNLSYYMPDSDFDEICAAPYTDKREMFSLIDGYVAEFETRHAARKKYRPDFPFLTLEMAQKWRMLYRPEDFDAEKADTDKVSVFLQKHEGKIKDLLIICRNL